jgi:hypothetical protein
MRRSWFKYFLAALATLGCLGEAMAEYCAEKAPCARPTAWNTAFDTFDITVPGKKPGESAHWRVEASFATGDFRIAVDQTESKKRMRGRLAMVGGRVLITKDLALEDGYEIDAVDAPLLYALLTAKLLGSAFPQGPDSLNGTRSIKFSEKREGFRIGTPSASADFMPPWTLTGTATKEESGSVRFDLRFTSTLPAGSKPPTFTVALKGSLEHAARDPALNDDMRLEGWKVYGVGPRVQKQGDSTMYDYGATADTKGYETVGEVRKAIAEENSPGTPDTSKDFSGFWKEKCEQDFGLQIKPAGEPGMYTVGFCGPGACDDHPRRSFINGDKRYEVVTQDELKERSGSGWTMIYKCSPDPDATPVRR